VAGSDGRPSGWGRGKVKDLEEEMRGVSSGFSFVAVMSPGDGVVGNAIGDSADSGLIESCTSVDDWGVGAVVTTWGTSEVAGRETSGWSSCLT